MNVQSKSVTAQLFDECFPEEWCIQVLAALNEVWRESREHCRSGKFGVNEGRDLVSHYIRAQFETKLRRISEPFDVNAESRQNRRKTASHTYIKASNTNGDSMILTASAVRSYKARPRRADFRHVYNLNGQFQLWEPLPQADTSSDPIYGLILYGPPQANAPSFVTVGFPSKHWKGYVERIDLMARYPGVVSTDIPEEIVIPMPALKLMPISPEEDIQKEQRPRIRPRRKSVGEE
jgi:hypothetical protein